MGFRRHLSYLGGLSILVLLLGTACGDTSQVENLNGGKIDVIGHGGAGLRSRSNPWADNSEPSLRRALDGYRADGVEIDLQLTRDGVVVLFHDELLDANTNCRGIIYDKSWQEIKDCRYVHAYSFGPSGDGILRFDKAMADFAKRSPRPQIYLDVKAFPLKRLGETFDADFADAISATIAKYDAYQWAMVTSGRLRFLHEIRIRLGDKVRILLGATSFEHALTITAIAKLDGFLIVQQRINQTQIREAHRRGLWVVLYNVRSAISARHAVESWPDAVQTDNIRVMQAALP